MLSNRYFYFQLTRKYVILFGNMFNNITLKRINRATNVEVERIKIPIIYAPKEKYIARLRSDPDLNREIQVALPRMSFELQSFTYDPTRKQNSLLKKATPLSNSQVSSQYVGVPYDLTFDLHVYTRNIDDGTHIVEQIIPWDQIIVNQKDRPTIIRAFESDPNFKCVIADPQATAHGINEFVVADTVIWAGPTEKTRLYIQGNARVHRPGQKYPVNVVQLVSNPLEIEIFRRLENNLSLQGSLLTIIHSS